jgi:thiamine phosphate synthase YjbQ (UPF0047 family)
MQKTIVIKTINRNGLYDITGEVGDLVRSSGIKEGITSVYARGSTAAIMIQEN